MELLKKIDSLTEKLASVPLPPDIVNLYNEVLTDIDYLINRTQEDNSTPIKDKELRELWELFEKQRFQISGKRYDVKTRKIAIEKIFELANKDWNKFRNIVEWAITLGYPDITPKILDYITPQQGKLFRESVYANYNEFVWFFRNKEYYLTADFKYYYDKILYWSESKNVRKRHWGYAAMLFIEQDQVKNKLVKLSPESIKRETITGDKLKKIFNEAINAAKIDDSIKVFLLNAKPLSLFRFNLVIECSEAIMQQMEKNIILLKPAFYKYNIRTVTYKILKR